MGAFLNFLNFLKISGLCQKHALPQNLLEKLGEVFKNNFLTAMYGLKVVRDPCQKIPYFYLKVRV